MRTAALPFATGLVLAYLLMPLVRWLETHLPPRQKWPGFRRIISVLIAFLALLCVVGGIGYVVATAVVDAAYTLTENVPYFIGKSLLEVQIWFHGIIDKLPVELQQSVNAALVQSGVNLGGYIRDALLSTITTLPDTFGMIIGFFVLPFFLFYILKDSDKLKAGYVAAVSASVAEHTRNIFDIVERVLGRYIRAQLMLGVIVGYFSFVGLWLLGAPFPLALALLAGATELIPILGPWISGIVAVIVTLAVVPDKAIWVAVLFIGIQLVENSLLVPKVQSAYLRIHPAVMIVLLVFGAYIAGFWGILLAGPLAATALEIYRYIYERYRRSLRDEGRSFEPGA